VEHLALDLACCLALVLRLAVVHPGLPLALVLLEQPARLELGLLLLALEQAWRLALE